MKKYTLLLSSAAMLFVTASSAQELNVPYGYLVRQAEFKISDMYDFSRFNANMGTARSAAMAGAFTSLGADLSSMNINPAGLGMYRTSEFGTTMSLVSTRSVNSVPGAGSTNGWRTNAAFNNMGAAFNIYEGSGRLTSFTLGVNYNKLADYNYRSRVDLAHTGATILDMFDKVVNVYTADAGHGALEGDTPWGSLSNGGAFYEEWGAVLAYKTGLIQRRPGRDDYEVTGVSVDADISNHMNTLSEGSAGEYTFSAGWNYSNKLYVGVSLGMIEYYNFRRIDYSETYADNVPVGDRVANIMKYYQKIRTTGEGCNLKLGVIYRPVPELRMGFAVHSPSIVTLRTTYKSDMSVGYKASGNNVLDAWPPEQSFIERFYTPTRILAGLSYTFGESGVLAFDYEYADYGGIRARGSDYDGYVYDDDTYTYKQQYKDQVKNDFRGAHALRVGGEMRPSDNLFIRAGGSYTIEGLAREFMDGKSVFETPLPKSSLALSAGLGFRLSSSSSLDLTYVYSRTKHTRYDLYSYDYQVGSDGAHMVDPIDGVQVDNVSINSIDLSRDRHNVMLSLNFRF